MKQLLLLAPLALLSFASCSKNQDGISDSEALPTLESNTDPYAVPQDPVATAQKSKPKVKTYNGTSDDYVATPNIPHEPIPDSNDSYTPPSYTGNSYGSPSYGAANATPAASTYTPPAPSGSTSPSYGSPAPAAVKSSAALPAPAATAPSSSETAHTVAAGDTLWGLSKKYGVSVQEIQKANKMKDAKIMTGKTIKIPAAR